MKSEKLADASGSDGERVRIRIRTSLVIHYSLGPVQPYTCNIRQTKCALKPRLK